MENITNEKFKEWRDEFVDSLPKSNTSPLSTSSNGSPKFGFEEPAFLENNKKANSPFSTPMVAEHDIYEVLFAANEESLDKFADGILILNNVYDLTENFPIVGYPLNVKRFAGSESNPWLMRVKRIQYTSVTDSLSLGLNDFNLIGDSDEGKTYPANAVLPLLDPKRSTENKALKNCLRSKFFHLLMTFVATRKADVDEKKITDAYFALLANTLVSCLRELAALGKCEKNVDDDAKDINNNTTKKASIIDMEKSYAVVPDVIEVESVCEDDFEVVNDEMKSNKNNNTKLSARRSEILRFISKIVYTASLIYGTSTEKQKTFESDIKNGDAHKALQNIGNSADSTGDADAKDLSAVLLRTLIIAYNSNTRNKNSPDLKLQSTISHIFAAFMRKIVAKKRPEFWLKQDENKENDALKNAVISKFDAFITLGELERELMNLRDNVASTDANAKSSDSNDDNNTTDQDLRQKVELKTRSFENLAGERFDLSILREFVDVVNKLSGNPNKNPKTAVKTPTEDDLLYFAYINAPLLSNNIEKSKLTTLNTKTKQSNKITKYTDWWVWSGFDEFCNEVRNSSSDIMDTKNMTNAEILTNLKAELRAAFKKQLVKEDELLAELKDLFSAKFRKDHMFTKPISQADFIKEYKERNGITDDMKKKNDKKNATCEKAVKGRRRLRNLDWKVFNHDAGLPKNVCMGPGCPYYMKLVPSHHYGTWRGKMVNGFHSQVKRKLRNGMDADWIVNNFWLEPETVDSNVQELREYVECLEAGFGELDVDEK